MNKTCIALALAGMVGAAEAAVVVKPHAYEIDGEAFEGLIIYDDAVTTPRPGLMMVPNWLGVTERSAEKAARAAGEKYVVFMADMYGKSVRPSNPDEAKAAVDAFESQKVVPVDTAKMAAIGFCFGGGAVLELARSGADLDAFVSFHGNLDTPNPEDAKQIKAPVLVLHGADDPAVPKEQVDGFVAEMKATDVDWQMVAYGNAVHSFTDPYANVPGRNEYHPEVAKRAFQAMNDLLDETLCSAVIAPRAVQQVAGGCPYEASADRLI